jgi:hypothetical protein
MYFNTFLLFCIALLLCLGAVISFSLFVIKPVQTRWAVRQARKIVAGGDRGTDWQFRNVRRMLATAHDDLEAVELWHELKKLPSSPVQSKSAAPTVKLVKSLPKTSKAAVSLSTRSTIRSSSPVKTSKPRKSSTIKKTK